MYDRQSIDASLQTMVVTIKPVLEALHMENVETVPRVSAIDRIGLKSAIYDNDTELEKRENGWLMPAG